MSSVRSPLDIPEILGHVLGFVNGRTLSACLQVNRLWRDEARRWDGKPRARCLLTSKRVLTEALEDMAGFVEEIAFVPDVAMVFVTGFNSEVVRQFLFFFSLFFSFPFSFFFLFLFLSSFFFLLSFFFSFFFTFSKRIEVRDRTQNLKKEKRKRRENFAFFHSLSSSPFC